jgi:hypothetical protein
VPVLTGALNQAKLRQYADVELYVTTFTRIFFATLRRMDAGCVGGRPSRARIRCHSHPTRVGIRGSETINTVKPKADICHRRYSDSEDKSSRSRILPGEI